MKYIKLVDSGTDCSTVRAQVASGDLEKTTLCKYLWLLHIDCLYSLLSKNITVYVWESTSTSPYIYTHPVLHNILRARTNNGVIPCFTEQDLLYVYSPVRFSVFYTHFPQYMLKYTFSFHFDRGEKE